MMVGVTVNNVILILSSIAFIYLFIYLSIHITIIIKLIIVVVTYRRLSVLLLQQTIFPRWNAFPRNACW